MSANTVSFGPETSRLSDFRGSISFASIAKASSIALHVESIRFQTPT